jgi:hypothetical protein
MQTLGLIAMVLKHLPQILRLVELLEQAEREAKTQRKVAEDLEKINQAFEAKDASKLKELFNS